jgi:hypothetical protein
MGLIFLFLSSLPLFGETVAPFVMPSARSSALGGTHAAQSDDFNSLFTNPASFVGIDREFSAAELSISIYGPVFEILDLVINADSFDNLDISGIIGSRGFAAGLEVGGPVAFGWVGRGLGLGLFSHFAGDASVTGTTIRPNVRGEALLVGGYSFRAINKNGHTFDAGFLGKAYYRAGIDLESSIFDITTIFDDPGAAPFKTTIGAGFDLGLHYSFAETFSAALVCLDTYSPALITSYQSFSAFQNKEQPLNDGVYGVIKPRLNLGLKYRVRSPYLDRYISNFSIFTDYRDFIDLFSLIPRNPILNVGIGVEIVVLEKLSFRIGIADALPALGLGLDLSFMTLDCSIYGKELGLDPGIQPTYAIDLGLLFRY